MIKKILITGGAGYIGTHCVYSALEQYDDVVVIDNLSTGTCDYLPDNIKFYHEDLANKEKIAAILRDEKPQAVIHFAGSIIVPESVSNPTLYYHNNVANSLALIENMLAHHIKYFIFSSTAAVYGMGNHHQKINETEHCTPINPYGQSKLMIEKICHDVAHAHDFHYAALRYFNVAGADTQMRCGQASKNATHLLKLICETIIGKHKTMSIFGDDYDTIDGTCIRDFIHPTDLVNAHLKILDYIDKNQQSVICNCGNGKGFSVKQIIEAAKKISQYDFPVTIEKRRAGDPAQLVADTALLTSITNWLPQYNLDMIIQTALDWEKSIV